MSKVVTARGMVHPAGSRESTLDLELGAGYGKWAILTFSALSVRESRAKLRMTRGSGQGAVPFEVFGLHFPLVACGDLITGCEVEKVGGRTIGETHDEREEAPRAKESELVSDLPTSSVKCVGEVIKRGDSVRLRDKVTQSLMIKSGRTNGEDTLTVAAHGAQGVESGGGESVCKGEEDYTEALTSGEGNKVTSFSCSRVCQET